MSVTLASFTSIVAAYQPALAGHQGAVRMQQLNHVPRRTLVRGASGRMAVEEATIVKPEVIVEPPHMPSNDESENLLKIRHTSAHVMAMAVQKL